MRAKQLIEEGFLGRPYSARVCYLHAGNSDPNRPTYWKIQKKYCGGGSFYDLASPVIDITRYLLGGFKKVFSKLEIFIKERSVAGSPGEKVPVDVDDLAILLFEIENGLIGTLEASLISNAEKRWVDLPINFSAK